VTIQQSFKYVTESTTQAAFVYLQPTNGKAVTTTIEHSHTHPQTHITLWPSIGPELGGTEVTINGYFPGNDELRCKFGAMPSLVTSYISDSTFTCLAPPHRRGGMLQTTTVVSDTVKPEIVRVTAWVDKEHLPDEKCSSSGCTQSLQTLRVRRQRGAQLAGAFTLSLRGEITVPIMWNATASEVKYKLSSLHIFKYEHNDAFIDVTECHQSGASGCDVARGGHMWQITFSASSNAAPFGANGNVPPIRADWTDMFVVHQVVSGRLKGGGNVSSPHIDITTLQQGDLGNVVREHQQIVLRGHRRTPAVHRIRIGRYAQSRYRRDSQLIDVAPMLVANAVTHFNIEISTRDGSAQIPFDASAAEVNELLWRHFLLPIDAASSR